VAHLGFLLLLILLSKRTTVLPHKVYTVNIVTPVVKKVKTPPPKRVKAEAAKPSAQAPKIPPKKTPAREKPKAPPRAVKPAMKEADLKNYVSERLTDIKARKEDEQYKRESLERIESKRKLEDIRQRALIRSRQGDDAASEAVRSKILDEYSGRIHDSIYDVWIFPDVELKGLQARIAITVMKNGTIILRRFEDPSGSKPYDRSALKALQKASPVEPPPFGEDIEYVITFIPYEK
jgi:colicin import membrane protein